MKKFLSKYQFYIYVFELRIHMQKAVLKKYENEFTNPSITCSHRSQHHDNLPSSNQFVLKNIFLVWLPLSLLHSSDRNTKN